MGDQLSMTIHLPEVLRSAQQSHEPTHGPLIVRRKLGLVRNTYRPVAGITQYKLNASVRVERAGKPCLRGLAAIARGPIAGGSLDVPADIQPHLTRKSERSIRPPEGNI